MDTPRTTAAQKATGSDGVLWALGAIGAAVYYVQQASSFLDGAFGILKALVWPAILAYYALRALGA